MIALFWLWSDFDPSINGVVEGKKLDTYSAPLKKIALIPSFLDLDIFKVQIRQSGTASIAISDSALKTEETM